MSALLAARYVVFGLVIFFSIIVLALSADLISQTTGVPSFLGFAPLALVVSSLTLLALGSMLVIDVFRKNASLSWIAIELPVMFILWILWLITGGVSASSSLSNIDCSVFGIVGFVRNCNAYISRYRTVEGFAFIIWLMLMIYAIILFALAMRSHTRGDTRIWKSTVENAQFFEDDDGVNNHNVAPQHNASYGVPQEQHAPADIPMSTHTPNTATYPGPQASPMPADRGTAIV